MTVSNAAADKVDKKAANAAPEKAHEKLAEKRRALGRGLESLLPGPRVVMARAASSLPRVDEVPAPAGSQLAVPGSQETHLHAASPEAVAGVVAELRAEAQMPEGDRAILLDLDQIGQNPYQTRTEFESKALTDLAGSIQTQGVLQPIVVRPAPVQPRTVGVEAGSPEISSQLRERYILILGERRFRASKIAGKTTIPAIVKRVSEQQAAEMTLVENLQRQDLDCLDQAAAFANLSTEFDLTQEEIGKRVGVSREQVSNYLRLLKLPPEVQVALRMRELTYSHARLLLALPDDVQITKVARAVIAKRLSVAVLQEMVMDSKAPDLPAERKRSGARWVDPNVREEQRAIETMLGMRVKIRDRKGKGTITIEYGTLEDFDVVVGRLKAVK
jgi:ParB family chromosome partitioning protein